MTFLLKNGNNEMQINESFRIAKFSAVCGVVYGIRGKFHLRLYAN
jgi:hypothetical protein